MPKAAPPELDDEPGRGRSLARHYPRDLQIEPHTHTWAQVLYGVSGVMWVEVEREALVVPPQRAVWLPPGTQHAIHMLSAVEMRNLYLHERDSRHLSERCEVFEINGLLRELVTSLAERAREVAPPGATRTRGVAPRGRRARERRGAHAGLSPQQLQRHVPPRTGRAAQ